MKFLLQHKLHSKFYVKPSTKIATMHRNVLVNVEEIIATISCFNAVLNHMRGTSKDIKL